MGLGVPEGTEKRGKEIVAPSFLTEAGGKEDRGQHRSQKGRACQQGNRGNPFLPESKREKVLGTRPFSPIPRGGPRRGKKKEKALSYVTGGEGKKVTSSSARPTGERRSPISFRKGKEPKGPTSLASLQKDRKVREHRNAKEGGGNKTRNERKEGRIPF